MSTHVPRNVLVGHCHDISFSSFPIFKLLISLSFSSSQQTQINKTKPSKIKHQASPDFPSPFFYTLSFRAGSAKRRHLPVGSRRVGPLARVHLRPLRDGREGWEQRVDGVPWTRLVSGIDKRKVRGR